ncbi:MULTISPECIES: hypothetical protein [Pseudomonas]|uniref:hypothetical protein n=1 Tax=Pseudomonas TaxID=286 RepID=UPI001F0FE7D8|nr:MULTISPECIES: hypothetical protein [Pseudomonas]
MVIWRYTAGIEIESVKRALKSSGLLGFVSIFDENLPIKNIMHKIINPRKIARLKDAAISDLILSVFKSVAPAMVISMLEKNPMPTTVIKDNDAKANDAALSESTM